MSPPTQLDPINLSALPNTKLENFTNHVMQWQKRVFWQELYSEATHFLRSILNRAYKISSNGISDVIHIAQSKLSSKY